MDSVPRDFTSRYLSAVVLAYLGGRGHKCVQDLLSLFHSLGIMLKKSSQISPATFLSFSFDIGPARMFLPWSDMGSNYWVSITITITLIFFFLYSDISLSVWLFTCVYKLLCRCACESERVVWEEAEVPMIALLFSSSVGMSIE